MSGMIALVADKTDPETRSVNERRVSALSPGDAFWVTNRMTTATDGAGRQWTAVDYRRSSEPYGAWPGKPSLIERLASRVSSAITAHNIGRTLYLEHGRTLPT
ncbi:hypothetical protein [Nonomuraea sp. NPDC003804]|uniref:hypothetical protein n=1 Tax=Nonomuraea sp. NPDC003804 TaxID=3154547 RepID=UPI0033BF47E6